MALRNRDVETPDKLDDSLFDESAGYEDDQGIQTSPGLSDIEQRQARAIYRLFNGLWGLCVIRGDPGAGKDTFLNWFLYTSKRYFPQKRILRDEKPRKLFGPYAGLFNEERLHDDLKRMREMAKGVGKPGAFSVDYLGALEKAADDWVSSHGQVLLKKSWVYLTELWRYCYNREPHNPMNKTMGAIFKVGRHLDCFVLGTIQLPSELDKKTCLPWIDWQVTCTRQVGNKTGFAYYIQKVKYDPRQSMLVKLGTPFPILLDAGKPRTEMGNGRIVLLKPDYRPQSEEERVVLDALKAGYDNYEAVANLLECEGDMTEQETLDTLKELKFRKSKRVIDFPCYFSLYNSKSAVNIDTRLKVQE